MKLEISKEELAALEIQHKKERDGRVRDRIKVVLLRSEDWMHIRKQALRIRIETVQEYLNDYVRSKKLKPENGGSAAIPASPSNPLQTMRTTNLFRTMRPLRNHPHLTSHRSRNFEKFRISFPAIDLNARASYQQRRRTQSWIQSQ